MNNSINEIKKTLEGTMSRITETYLKKSYTMTKWALSQECKDSLISANQSM